MIPLRWKLSKVARCAGRTKSRGHYFPMLTWRGGCHGVNPLRPIGEIVNAALGALSADFGALYAPLGRPSIAPEKLLRALLLQAFYSIRSERQLMERLEFDLLFRWFVGLGIDDAVWDHSVFSKNRDRLLDGEIAAKFLAAVLTQPRIKRLLSSDHFSVDGTLVEAWASMKSLKPRGGGDSDPPAGGGRNTEVDHLTRWQATLARTARNLLGARVNDVAKPSVTVGEG
jgi:transposase